MHNLFEIVSSSVEEFFCDYLRHFKMIGVSIVPNSLLIFYIDDSHYPIIFSFGIFIYSSLHADKVVSIGLFTSAIYCSIPRSSADISECEWHIWNSRWNLVIGQRRHSFCIGGGFEDLSDCLRLWMIVSSDSKVHTISIMIYSLYRNLANSKEICSSEKNKHSYAEYFKSKLVRYPHYSCNSKRNSNLNKVCYLGFDTQYSCPITTIWHMFDKIICIDRASSPEPPDNHRKYNTNNPRIRNIANSNIVDGKDK
jgi:hypothetical protein